MSDATERQVVFNSEHRTNADLALALRKAADTFDTAPLIREGILRMAADALDYLDIPPVPTTGLLTTEEWRDFQSIPDQGYSHRFWIDTKIEQRVQAERDRLTAEHATLNVERERAAMEYTAASGWHMAEGGAVHDAFVSGAEWAADKARATNQEVGS